MSTKSKSNKPTNRKACAMHSKTVQKYCRLLSKEYEKRQIPNAQKHINRLLKSVYPTQVNDYVMFNVKRPGNTRKSYDAPVDHPLFALIRYLEKHGYATSGWDHEEDGDCFVMIDVDKNFNNPKSLNTQIKLSTNLQTLFGKKTIIFKTFKRGRKVDPDNVNLEYFNDDAVSIRFHAKTLPKIMKKLKIRKSKCQVLPGCESIIFSDKDRQIVYDECVDEDLI